jgi:hypothetical protein
LALNSGTSPSGDIRLNLRGDWANVRNSRTCRRMKYVRPLMISRELIVAMDENSEQLRLGSTPLTLTIN